MKKIIFSVFLTMLLGFTSSLFAQPQGIAAWQVTTEGGTNSLGVWDDFSNTNYNYQSRRYITAESHEGLGYLDVIQVGSDLTPPVVGVGANDLTLVASASCNMSGYEECVYYNGNMQGHVNIHARGVSPDSVYDMRYHLRTP